MKWVLGLVFLIQATVAGKHKNKTSRPKPTDVSDYDDLYEIDGLTSFNITENASLQ